MRSVRALAGVLEFRAGERRLVALLLLEYFFIGISSVFTQSAAFALFLSKFGSDALPYSYLSVAVGASAIAFLYLKVSERFSISTSLILNLSTLALISLLLWFGLIQTDAPWLVFALPVWFQIIANLTALALWTLAARLLDVRQGKRLFGLIGSGNWVAVAASGFLVAPIVAWLGTTNLLLLAGLALLGALAFQIIILNEHREQLASSAPARATTRRSADSTPGLLKNRYLRSILLLISLVWIGFFFIDNIFYDVAATQLANVNQLASFIGTLNAVIGIIGLLTTTFITGPVISRIGVGNSLLILPGIVTITTALVAMTGAFAQIGLVLFVLASLTKSLDVALGFTLDLSARAILYQPLAATQRARIQTIADGITQPISIGIAGMLLLVFNTWLAFNAVQLALLFLVIGAAWLTIAFRLRRQYPLALVEALAKRQLGEQPNVQPDHTSIAVLQQALTNPHAGTVLYAAHCLEELEPGALADALPQLLAHPSAPVRRDALERIERQRLTQALAQLEQHLATEPSDELLGMTLRTLARLGNASERVHVATWLTHASPLVRRGAIQGLLDSTTADEQRAAERALQEMAASPKIDEREMAAELLGAFSSNRYEPLMVALLHDPAASVQRAALRSVARWHSPALWTLAVNALGVPRLRRAAMTALAGGGSDVLPFLQTAFRAPDADSETRQALAQVCGKIGGVGAVALLKDWLATPDSCARTAVCAALHHLNYHADTNDEVQVQAQLRNEIEYAARLCATLVDLGEDPALVLLNAALAAELKGCRDRVLELVAFVYDRAAMRNAGKNLKIAASEKRAYALEVLDVTLPQAWKVIVLPLAEGLAPAQMLNKLAPRFPQTHLSRAERLREISTTAALSGNAWLQATARYAAVRMGLTGAETQAEGDALMFSTIERVLVLKGVDIFAETPDAVLADVATACDELVVAPDETIFNKGDLGESLYVIVSGRVRVHDGAVTVSELGEADVFGEMALLDPEPRSASVTALEETRLLRLAEEPFQELLQEQSEIAQSIIKVLTRRLRARMQDLTRAIERNEPQIRLSR